MTFWPDYRRITHTSFCASRLACATTIGSARGACTLVLCTRLVWVSIEFCLHTYSMVLHTVFVFTVTSLFTKHNFFFYSKVLMYSIVLLPYIVCRYIDWGSDPWKNLGLELGYYPHFRTWFLLYFNTPFPARPLERGYFGTE